MTTWLYTWCLIRKLKIIRVSEISNLIIRNCMPLIIPNEEAAFKLFFSILLIIIYKKQLNLLLSYWKLKTEGAKWRNVKLIIPLWIIVLERNGREYEAQKTNFNILYPLTTRLTNVQVKWWCQLFFKNSWRGWKIWSIDTDVGYAGMWWPLRDILAMSNRTLDKMITPKN